VNLARQRLLINRIAKQPRRLAAVIFGLHQLLVVYLLTQHELWRDELQAWSIAKASTSPLDVIRNTQFEGRPPLWQLVLWPLTRISDNPNTMKFIAFAIGTAAMWLWMRSTALPLALRTLIAFGFLFTGGYFGHSREYILMLLLLLFAIQATNSDPLSKTSTLLICLLSGVNLFGLVMAAALVLATVLKPSLQKLRPPINRTTLATATRLSVLTATFALSAYWIYPKSESQFGAGTYIGWQRPLANAIFPFTANVESNRTTWAILAIGTLCALAIGLFIASRTGCVYLVSACVVLSLNASFGYAFYWWHWGAVAIVAVTSPLVKTRNDPPRNIAYFVIIPLVFIACAGLVANWKGPGELVYGQAPYSMSQKTAEQLKDICQPDCTIIVDWDATGAAISSHLGGKSLYYLNRQEFGTFALFVRTNASPTWEQAISTMQQFDRPILVTTDLLTGVLPNELEMVSAPWGGVWDNALILQLASKPIRPQ
jgi:hypothetical protein